MCVAETTGNAKIRGEEAGDAGERLEDDAGQMGLKPSLRDHRGLLVQGPD